MYNPGIAGSAGSGYFPYVTPEYFPKVGDRLVNVVMPTDFGVKEHCSIGEVRTVVSASRESDLVTFDICSCERSKRKKEGCSWSWGIYRNLFALEPPITPEEAAKAIPLSDPDDVLKFLKRHGKES